MKLQKRIVESVIVVGMFAACIVGMFLDNADVVKTALGYGLALFVIYMFLG